MTEADTCRELVTPKLVESGWPAAPHDIAPWLDYFWGALLRAHKEFEERVGTIGRGAKGYMVRLMLGTMKAEGLIVPTGKGRGVKWVSVTHQQKSQE